MEETKLTPDLVDPCSEYERIDQFVSDVYRRAGSETAVVGLSGGIDSATVAALCARIMDRKNLICVFMPEQATPQKDARDVEKLRGQLDIQVKKMEIGQIASTFMNNLSGLDRLGKANLKARIRMTILYGMANKHDGLVVGTSNLSEWLLGYFTKYGDGVSDLAPVAHLYKTELRQLADWLELPSSIIKKAPSAGLWPGQKDKDELGAEYPTLDRILHCLHELHLEERETAKKLDLDPQLVNDISEKMENTAHKRKLPPTLNRADRRRADGARTSPRS